MYDVVALGELLIDFTTQSIDSDGYPTMAAHPGGAPANFLGSDRQIRREGGDARQGGHGHVRQTSDQYAAGRGGSRRRDLWRRTMCSQRWRS